MLTFLAIYSDLMNWKVVKDLLILSYLVLAKVTMKNILRFLVCLLGYYLTKIHCCLTWWHSLLLEPIINLLISQNLHFLEFSKCIEKFCIKIMQIFFINFLIVFTYKLIFKVNINLSQYLVVKLVCNFHFVKSFFKHLFSHLLNQSVVLSSHHN